LAWNLIFFLRTAMSPNPRPYFEQVPDPRMETPDKRHALPDIRGMALFAVLSKTDDRETMEDFRRGQEAERRRLNAATCSACPAPPHRLAVDCHNPWRRPPDS
jgi:hypothetical protein